MDKEKLRVWLARYDNGDLCNAPSDFIVSCLRAHLATLDAVSKEDAEQAAEWIDLAEKHFKLEYQTLGDEEIAALKVIRTLLRAAAGVK